LFRHAAYLFCGLLLLCPWSSAAFVNGEFETGDLTGWTLIGTGQSSSGQSYEEVEVFPFAGSWAAELNSGGTSGDDIAVTLGVDHETLNDSNNGVVAESGSLLWQSVLLNAGDTIQFRWNFVAGDSAPYSDWAIFGLSFNGGPSTLQRLSSVDEFEGAAEEYQASGWQYYSATVADTGVYTLYFGVLDGLEEGFSSYLWVDSISVSEAGAVPEPGTLAFLAIGLVCIALNVRRRRG